MGEEDRDYVFAQYQSDRNVIEIEDDSSSGNQAASDAANQAYEDVTEPKRFPSKTSGEFFFNDDNGNPQGPYKILYPLDKRICFPSFPNYHMKVDIDSLYAYNRSFKTLLQDCSAENCMLTLPATTAHTQTANGSRFFIDTVNMQNKPKIRGINARKIGMEKFPNISIGTLSLRELHRPLTIYFYNMATPKITSTNMFTKEELAVLNTVLNMAREMSKDEAISNDRQDLEKSFLDFHPFKSTYGTISARSCTRDYNELTMEEMIIFAKNMEISLKQVADNESEYPFWLPKYYQIISDEPFTISREKLVETAKELNAGATYVASLSGVKKFFNTTEYQREPRDSQEFLRKYQDRLIDNEERLVDEANQLLMEEHDADDLDELPLDVHPFKMRDEREGSGEVDSRELCLEDINSDFPSYEILFGHDYENDKRTSFMDDTMELNRKLDTLLKKIFPVREDRNTSIFFDIGMEVRLKGDNSILVDVNKAYPRVLQAASKP